MDPIAAFYDARVENPADLNARLAAVLARPAHHHAGIVRCNEEIPADAESALIWLYYAEEALCDMVWHVIHGLSSRQPNRLLDLGCGEGGTAARFTELCPGLEIAGVTLSAAQGQIAIRNCPGAQFIVGDMLSVEIPAPFDVVYAIESTEYLGSPGLAWLMERVGTWLSPGGLLVIVAGSRAPTLPPDDPLVWAFDVHYKTRLACSSDYRRLATQAGLRLAAEIDLGPVTLNYWRARRDHPVLRNSSGGTVEALIAKALEEGKGEYHLWAWYYGERSG